MWSVWLALSDCGFQSICPLIRIKILWKLPDGRDWLGLVLMGGAMLSKSLIQFPVERWGCVPSLFDLRPNYGRDNEENGDLIQKVLCTHCHTQCFWPRSSPLLTRASAKDSWTLSGKSGSVLWGHSSSFLAPVAHKVFFKIFQARFQQYVNCELPDDQAEFRKFKGARDQIANSHWII